MSGTASAGPMEALEVIAALRKFGWHQESILPGMYEAWTAERDRRGPSIVVPLDPSKGDYEHLLSRARQALVDSIGVKADHFIQALHRRMSAALDLTRFGKETAADAGAIAWRQGKTLIQSVEASLMAAAKASSQPRRYHGNSSANIAREFLDATLMGQTEVGSYVVRAYTPASQRFYLSSSPAQRSGLPDLAGRTGRQIIATLERSVKITREAIDEFARVRRVELFAEAVEDGVSFELVRALAELARDSERAMVLINYADHLDERAPDVSIGFSATDAPMLDSAANHLAAERALEEVTLRGRVAMLRGRGVGEAGVIALDVIGSASANKVRVRLSPEDYERAWSAHGENALMVVTGRLEREAGTSGCMNPPRSGLSVR